MKKIYFILSFILLVSCNRNVSPRDAATKGGMKCGKQRLR